MDKNFSVILPAHNEEKTVAKVVLAALNTNAAEVIVVDDGSKDSTYKIVRSLTEDPRLKIVRHPVNRGVGAAYRSGIEEAKSNILVFFDSDIETVSSKKISDLAEAVIHGGDYAIGVFENFGRVTEFFARPLLRHFLPELSSLKQPLSGLFAIRREFINPEKIGEGYSVLGILLDAYFLGAKICEIDVGEIVHDKRPNEAKVDQASEECRVFFRKLEEYRAVSPAIARAYVV